MHATHSVGRIERLGNGDECRLATLEYLDELVKTEQRAGKPIDFVHNNNINTTSLDVYEKAFEGRAVKRPPRYAAIVVTVRNQDPAFPSLAGDVSLASLPLGFQRVELHLEAFFTRFAGIDRAPEFLVRRHGGELLPGHATPRWFFRPKNTQPFQRTPVMARAMAES